MIRSRSNVFVTVCALAGAALLPRSAHGEGRIVISQVYGGGGNSGATLKNDFIELFNRGGDPVDVTGWSVQYASATGSSWQVTQLSGTIQPGQYYLVQERAGSGGTVDLPTPDAMGDIAMSATAGKVALVSSTTPLTGTCPTANAIDFVGFGTTPNCQEGTGKAPAPSNTTAALRKNAGCTDTNDNAADFETGEPNPRNSSVSTPVCVAATNPLASGSAVPNPVRAGDMLELTVTVIPGQDPASTGITVTGDLSAIGGSAEQAFAAAGGNIFTYLYPVPCTAAVGDVVIPIQVKDEQNRQGNTAIPLTVSSGTLVIAVHPSNTTICPGETVAFTVGAAGGGLSYQWHNAGGPLFDGGGITGAHAATLQIANATQDDIDAGPYYVVVSGVCAQSPLTSNTADFSFGTPVTEVEQAIVISQVYGGGGNAGSTYSNDFIELFNRGTERVYLDGWSVQYASSNVVGSAPRFENPPRMTLLSGYIDPGHFFLIQEAAGAGGSIALPSPDVDGTAQPGGGIAIGAQGGKVALVKHANPITGTCPLSNGSNPDACSIVDFVGWNDTSGCYLGAKAAPGTSNTTAIVRSDVCQTGADDNSTDYVVAAPHPRNHNQQPEPLITSYPVTQSFCDGASAVFSITATGACLSYQWEVNTGGGWQSVTAGTGSNSPTYATEPLTPTDNGRQYRVVVSGPYGPSVTSEPATAVYDPVDEVEKQLVISQIYPAGGNTGGTTPAVYKQDFIEIYNRGTTPVNVAGWSVQYASATGPSGSGTWLKVDLSGSIEPGRYYLITAPGGGGGTLDIPAASDLYPNTSEAGFQLGAAGGKVALVRSASLLPAQTCPADCRIVDFVGYGTANCYEGSAAAGYANGGDNTLSLARRELCGDTDDNAADFVMVSASPGRVPGNVNGDSRVDQTDYEDFAACATGPEVPAVSSACRIHDLDNDNDVDQIDFGLFQNCYSGVDLAHPGCLCE